MSTNLLRNVEPTFAVHSFATRNTIPTEQDFKEVEEMLREFYEGNGYQIAHLNLVRNPGNIQATVETLHSSGKAVREM